MAGLAWLQQVFEHFTVAKARRKCRLLLVHGHGSHPTEEFLEYCPMHKILLGIYPPHSTHTLQPLHVVMPKPLSTAYSKKLGRSRNAVLGIMWTNRRGREILGPRKVLVGKLVA